MINEISIEKIFDNNLSPSVQLTPSKRQQIDNNEQISSVSKRRGLKYTNEDIPTKFNKILVQDTPTPFMNRRIKSTNDVIVQNSANNINNKESSKKQNRIIPNTPVIRSLTQTQSTKKVKKLFDNNALLLEEEELPGVEIDLRKNITESSKKFSSLFKPKSKLNDKENENDYSGCELSFETLERRQRRKNHLVARLSEIEDLKLKYETKNQTKQNDELKLIEEKQNEIYPSSPILTKVNSYQIDSETYNSEFTKILSKTPKTAEKVQSKFITFNHSSFTNVTENEFDMKTTRWTQKEQTLIETNSLNENEISSELNEDEINLILFNGLKIDMDKTKTNSNRMNKMFRLVDKTNTSDKSIRSMSNTIEKRNTKIIDVKDNKKKRSLSATIQKNKKYFPNQMKKFNFSFIDLDKNQEEFLKKTIEKLKLVDSPTNKNKKTCIKCTINKQFSFNTTHLIIDFQRTFENNILDTNDKFLLILAALKNCKLIRYEWLNHSYMKNKWIDESRYLIQSYITSDLDEYDQNEFDIKLIKFIRNLDLTSKISLFSHYGNIYILNDLPDDLESVEINQNYYESESENDNESLSFQKFSDSFSIYKSKEKTYDFILELITKCDGLVTSRVACADLIVAIDRKDDFDMSNELDKLFLKKQSNYLENCFRDIKTVLKKMKQKRNLQVISSSWIIDCVLENSKVNKDEYEVGWIRVKDQQE